MIGQSICKAKVGCISMIGPFLGRERAGLQEDAVGDAHLADVVEQGPTADVFELLLDDAQLVGQEQGQAGDALAVARGLLVAQLQGTRPALDGGVVGVAEVAVGALQNAEGRRIVGGAGVPVPAIAIPDGRI